jgi:hypothetical protein
VTQRSPRAEHRARRGRLEAAGRAAEPQRAFKRMALGRRGRCPLKATERADGSREMAGWVTWRRVSPGPAGLGRGVLVAPGFRHAETFGDTEYVFCVIERRIVKH